MNAYYLLSRLASPVITALFYVYSLLTSIPRARLVIQNEDGEILLLQAWPDTSVWNLPGGGLKRGERPEVAASRELWEETGINVMAEAMMQRTKLRTHGHEELIYAVVVRKDNLPAVPPNRWEVRRAGWFLPESLPKVSAEAQRIIAEVAAGR